MLQGRYIGVEGNERFKPYNHREMAYEMNLIWEELGVDPDKVQTPCDFVPKNTYLEDYLLDDGKDTLVCFDGFVGFGKDSLDEDAYEEEALDGVYNFCRRVDHMMQELVETAEALCEEDENGYAFRQKMLVDFMAPVEKKHSRPYVALLMEYCNQIQGKIKEKKVSGKLICSYLKLLSVFAPVVAENSYQMLVHGGKLQGEKTILQVAWPQPDADFLQNGEIEIPVQMRGKTKAVILLARNASKQEAMEKAAEALRQNESIQSIGQLRLDKMIYVEGKIINFI